MKPPRLRAALVFLLGMVWALPLSAQVVLERDEQLDFERPESWAMAYMSAATLFSGFGSARATEPGSFRLGAELGHVPRLSTEQRRVGFDGTKLEDLNKTPVFGRLRLWIGLPADLTLELNWTPPVELGGAKPRNFFGAALERPLFDHNDWRASARLYYQRGQVRGDFTCDRDTASFDPGSPENPFGCQAPSSDRFNLDYHGLELAIARQLMDGNLEPYLAYAFTRMKPTTQVHASVFSVIDRAHLSTRGNTHTATLGIVHRPTSNWEILAAIAWTPLKIRRPPTYAQTRDDLWSARLMSRVAFDF